MTASLSMPVRPSRVRILAALAESPGLGAYELAAVLGCDARRVAGMLPRMRDAGLVVAHELAKPGAGHIWFVAPEGTPPRPQARRAESSAADGRRRRTLARLRACLPPPPPVWDMPAEPACQTADPRLFFGPELEGPQARARRVAAAQGCVLTVPCAPVLPRRCSCPW